MKTIATTFFLVWTSLIFIVPPALSGNRLPVPPTIRNPDKQNPELLKLKKLLDDGQIIPFYQAADSILNEMSLYRKKKRYSGGIAGRSPPVQPDYQCPVH